MAKRKKNDGAAVVVAEAIGRALGMVVNTADALKAQLPHPIDEAMAVLRKQGAKASTRTAKQAKNTVKQARTATRKAVTRARKATSTAVKRVTKTVGRARKTVARSSSKRRR